MLRLTLGFTLAMLAATSLNGCSSSSSADSRGLPIVLVPELEAILDPTPLPSGLILFRGDASGSNDLWVTDLTETGTRLLLNDATPGGLSLLWNDQAVIFGENPVTGAPGIWLSDGTDEGTTYVDDLTTTPYDFSLSGAELDGDFLIVTGRVQTSTGQLIEWVLVAIPLA